MRENKDSFSLPFLTAALDIAEVTTLYFAGLRELINVQSSGESFFQVGCIWIGRLDFSITVILFPCNRMSSLASWCSSS